MPPPPEIAFEGLLFGGIVTTAILVGALILFVVGYQRRLLEQQQHLQQVQSAYQHRMLLAGIQVQEAERSRIGHDLHDEVGSSLATIKLLVGQAERMGKPNAPEDAQRAVLRSAQQILSDTSTEIRTISHSLYPAVLHRFGLWEALTQLADALAAAGALHVELAVTTAVRLPPAKELALYRMAQELTANALRHSEATWLLLEATATAEALTLTVQDNGRGFEYPSAVPAAGVGLSGVEARASMLRAALYIASSPGQGTCATVVVPLHDPALSSDSL